MFSETGSQVSQVSLELVEDDLKCNSDPPAIAQVLEPPPPHLIDMVLGSKPHVHTRQVLY